jgi:hypothetical protein
MKTHFEQFAVYNRWAGPLTFGSGFAKSADSASGNVTFSDGTASIGVPPGYISDSPLGTSTDTWNSASFLTLHVTPGIYEWTWGNGADQSFTLCAGVACPVAPATPLPATLPPFASGLGALGLLARRRKRRAQTVG